VLGLGLLGYVPEGLRPAVVRTSERIQIAHCRLGARAFLLRQKLAPALPRARLLTGTGPIAVVGIFSSSTGLAQGARLMVKDLTARGHDIVAVDVTRFLKLPGDEPTDGALTIGDLTNLPVSKVIIHLNPPKYSQIYFALPQPVKVRARVIAYWAWELECTPSEWKVAAKFCDEIWVPSKFVAHALLAQERMGQGRPVRVVPHAVDVAPIGPRKTRDMCLALRNRHGLRESTFVVGYSFSMGSVFARKNPLGTIEAFRRAFPLEEGADVALVIRCTDADCYPPGLTELQDAWRRDHRILLVDGRTRRMDIRDLYYLIDVYLSLQRSEGYGLTLAEAAQVGTAVVTTDWWLADDIRCRPEVETVPSHLVPVVDRQGIYNGVNNRWAEPDLEVAAAILRQHYVASMELTRIHGHSVPAPATGHTIQGAERNVADGTMFMAGQAMTTALEKVVDAAVSGEETLGVTT
jgi:glycosyltransferase involved in cell wall biosynthesis